MLKKILILFVLVFSFQSCFRTHKARRIDVNELDVPKNDGTSSFVFEYDGNQKNFEKTSMKFFQIKEDYLPFSFTTTQLYPKDTLSVFLSAFQDKDKWIRLVTLSQLLGSDKDESISKVYNYYYISVQVTDQDGNDILREESMRNKTIIERLNRYQRLID